MVTTPDIRVWKRHFSCAHGLFELEFDYVKDYFKQWSWDVTFSEQVIEESKISELLNLGKTTLKAHH
jgi:hypothetical protein